MMLMQHMFTLEPNFLTILTNVPYFFPEAQPLGMMKHRAPAVIKLAPPRLFQVI